MKRTLIVVAMLAVLLGGCVRDWDLGGVTWTPKARLVAARETFTSTVRALTALKHTFTKAQAEAITPWILAGQQALDQWQAAVELGQPPDMAKEDFDKAMLKLKTAEIAAERAAPKKENPEWSP